MRVQPASIFRLSGTLLCTGLFLGTTLLAQDPATRPAPKPVTTQPTSQPTPNPDEAKQGKQAAEAAAGVKAETPPPRELTPQERLAALQETLDKVKREKKRLESILERGGLPPRVVERIKRRNVRGDDATQLGPAMPKPKHARLLGDAERKTLAEDVVFTVDSMPVTQKEFDSVYSYLRSYPRKDTAAAIKAEAILTLVKSKAAQVAAKDNREAALAQIKKIHSELESGASFADLARKYSQDKASAAKGGDLGYITRDFPDKLCAQALFTMNLGQVSEVVSGTKGYHILRVRGAKKGDTADKDRVRASHIMVLYTKDMAAIQEVMERVANANVDLAFREKDLRKFAPKQFNPE